MSSHIEIQEAQTLNGISLSELNQNGFEVNKNLAPSLSITALLQYLS